MTISPTLLALSTAFLGLSVPAAHASADVAFADARPVSDVMLDQIHGMGWGLIGPRNLRTITTQRFRDDTEFMGAIGQTQMDVWWQTDGAQLIAASVRADLSAR